MKVVELCAGTSSFSNISEIMGHDTFTVDIDEQFEVDLYKDVREIEKEDIPFDDIDIVFVSIPCTTVSSSAFSNHYDKIEINKSEIYKPISEKAKEHHFFIHRNI